MYQRPSQKEYVNVVFVYLFGLGEKKNWFEGESSK